MEVIRIELGERSYPILVDYGILKDIGETLKKHTNSIQTVVVTNPTVGKLYLERVRLSLESSGFEVKVIEIPDGEEYKSLKWAEKIFDKLIDYKIDRYTPLIALGGGVIGDITGFVASTYLRGVPYIQVPTTLLSQVDSSVGGKTAVNHEKGKNLIGAFYQPKLVYIDIQTLETLPEREVRAGLAEVIKYGVIRDADFFGYLENIIGDALALDRKVLINIIRRSCEIKAEVVEADERESGCRAFLNFGHTFGHAIEAITNYKKFKHGEAVAMGMVFAGTLSESLGLCSTNTRIRIERLVAKAQLPSIQPVYEKSKYLDAMKLDKKVVGGELRFVLVEKLGNVTIQNVSEDKYGQLININN